MGQLGRLRIGVDLDLNKSKFNEVQAALLALLHITAKDLINSKNANEDLNSIISTAKKLEDVLNKSFNPKLNSINLSLFKRELGALNLKQVELQFAKVGTLGRNAFRNVAVELMTTNKHMKESSVLLDKMATTLANTVRWLIATLALNSMTGSVQKAYYFAKDLDTSLNDIRIVTEKGADEMAQFARHANKAAKELRALTTDYTKASLIYYQQGLGDQEVLERAETTVKVANVTKLSADTVSEQLTAIWNGYKASAAETEIYIDKVSAVAAKTAADLEELATGMSRVASAANIMGVDIDQLNAQLATIVSVTREAPESIGTALKTVYARMSDIEAGLDEETTLGEYTAQMAKFGINALDANRHLRDQGDVIEEIGNKWKSMTREQQTGLALTIAGTRQYSRMMALFDNWKMYEDALQTSKDSMGALQKQLDIYTESIEAHLKSLSAEGEEMYSTLFKPEDITPAIDAITTMIDAIENLVESIGGGKGLIKVLGSVGLNIFSDKITQGIGRTVRNISGFTDNLRLRNTELQIMKELDITDPNDKRMRNLIELKKKLLSVTELISEEEFKLSNEFIKHTNELYKLEDALKANKKEIQDYISEFTTGIVNFDQDGSIRGVDNLVKLIKNSMEEANPDAPKAWQQDIESMLKEALSIKRLENNIANRQGWVEKNEKAKDKLSIDDPAYAEKAAKLDEVNKGHLNKITATQEKIDVALKKLAQSLNRLFDESNSNFQELALSADKLKQTLTAEDLEKFAKAVEVLTKKFDAEGKEIEETEKYLKDLLEALLIYESLGLEITADKLKLIEKLKAYNDALKENQEELKKAADVLKELVQQFDLTKSIGKVVDALGMAANAFAGVTTLFNLDDIWNDENLTTLEKTSLTLTNLGVSLSMLAPILSVLTKKLIAHNAAKATEAATRAGNTTAINAETQALIKQEAIKKTIMAGAWIAAAVAVVAVVTAIAVKNYNKQADALRAANEEQLKMNENLTTALQRYDNVKLSIEGYNKLLETLKELTKGTTEWKEAILATNDAALKLLNTYPELAKYVEPGLDGTIQLSEAGLIEYQNRERAKVSAAQIAATNATLRQRLAQIEYDTAMLIRETTSDDSVSNSKVAQVIEKLSDISYPKLINSNDGLIKALNENPEALQKLTATIELNNKLLAIENAANYAEQLRAQGYSSEDAAVLGGIASANATNKDAEVEKRAAEIATRIKAINNEDLIKEWAEATGRTIEEGTLSKTGAGWGGRSGKFSIGNETFTFELLVKDLAAAEYDKEQTDAQSIKEYQDDLNKIQSKGVKDIVSSVAKASGAITANALEDFTGADIDALQELLGENGELSKSLLNFRDELNETVTNLEEARTNPTKAYGVNQSVVNAAVAGTDKDNWTALFDEMGSKAASNILDVGLNIFNVGGSTGLSAFLGFIEELGENALTVFTEVDFASEEWETQLLQTAEGIDLDKEALNRFQYYVKQFAPSTKTAEERLKNLNEVLASIKELGLILDPEKFETLKQELPIEELNNYFTQMADGTLMLTSAASLFVAEAREARRAQLLQGIDTEIGERDKWETDKNNLYQLAPNISGWITNEKLKADAIKLALDKARVEANTLFNLAWSDFSYQQALNDPRYKALAESFGSEEAYNNYIAETHGYNRQGFINYKVNNVKPSAALYQYLQYSLAEVELWIREAERLNLLTSDEATGFINESYNSEILKLYFGNNNAFIQSIKDTINQNISDAKFDDSLLKTLVLQYLENALSSAEYDDIINKFSGGPYQIDFEDTTADKGEKSWAEIAQSGKRLSRIQEQSNATAKYNQALTIQEEALANIERRMSDLADLSSVVYGSDAIENLSALNELLDERLQLLRDAEILENNRRQALFDDFKTDKADVSELQGALETILGSTDALDVVTIDDALKSLGLSSLESVADYQAFISALSSKVGSDELELLAFDIIRSILDPLFSGETEEKIRATILDQLSNNLEAFELELDLALNVTEAERSYNKFLHAIAKDEQEIFSTYISDAGTLANDMATYQKGLLDLATYEVVDDDRFKELQEEAKQKGYELAENLISATDFLAKRQALVNDLISTTIDLQLILLSVIELLSSALKKLIDYLNTVNSMLESLVELTLLIYGDDTDKVGDFYSKIVDNNIAIRDSAKATYDYWNATYADIQANPDQFSLEYKDKVLAELTSSTEQYMSAVTNVVKAQLQEYLNFLKQSLKEFKVESYGKEWDWIKFDEDQYLDSIDTLYAIEDLEATFRKAADESTDVKTQLKINSLLEDELTYLEQGNEALGKRDKLTLYDFDRAKKKLDILLAEIALEEARNSTTSMRLMRGADGTYGFQYVADMDAVSEAQENLREANQSLYELDTDRYRENLDLFYSIYQEYITKMEEAYSDGFISEEERAELDALEQLLNGIADLVIVSQENLRASATESVSALGGTVDDINSALNDKLNTGLSKIINDVKENGIQVVFADLLATIQSKANDYYTAVNKQETTLNNLLNNEENGTIKLYEELAKAQDTVIANTKSEAGAIKDNLLPAMEDLNKLYLDALEYLRLLDGYWNGSSDAIKKAEDQIAENTSKPKFEGRVENSQRWLDSSFTVTGKNAFKNTMARDEARTYFTNALDWIEKNANSKGLTEWFSLYSKSNTASSFAGLKDSLLNSRTEGYSLNSLDFWLLDLLIKAIENGDIPAFGTGGYTGEWGTDGRLAMLHEKEFVLNQTDTHNMLLAVSTLRNLASALDLLAMHTLAKALSNLESSIAAWELANEMNIELNVYITAEFPEATNWMEIREAILGLANDATQHAYKNTRV